MYFTEAGGTSVVAGPSFFFANPDWRLAAIGRGVVGLVETGPGAMALLRPASTSSDLHELLLVSVRHYGTLPPSWSPLHVRFVTATPPVEVVGVTTERLAQRQSVGKPVKRWGMRCRSWISSRARPSGVLSPKPSAIASTSPPKRFSTAAARPE